MFEYIVLLFFLLGALLVFQKYIVRAFVGGWKKAGDAFGHGQQYDPRAPADGGTATCSYMKHFGLWVDDRCYDGCAGGGSACATACPCQVGP